MSKWLDDLLEGLAVSAALALMVVVALALVQLAFWLAPDASVIAVMIGLVWLVIKMFKNLG